ncbi:DUF1801 domain-containing protein [Sulfitobacter sp. PS-8MA]|uniref:DUF1801 domain-containing protein n=1 Tax=Sulfitobacter sp. PS-8MA TaxID=3237707 RepID=UPI0034C68C84
MDRIYPPFQTPDVQAAFAAFPKTARPGLLALRRLIFDVAEEAQGVGPLAETLKWGQPAYLTPVTKSGSTLRLGTPKSGGIALYAHCQTTLISDFRSAFPETFAYEGNRAVLLAEDAPISDGPLRLLIAAALTYHL